MSDKANNTPSSKTSSVPDEVIISPASEIVIKGESITVNEINYMQGLKLHHVLQPVLDDIAEQFTEENTDFNAMAAVFADHIDVINKMILVATGKDERLFENLGDEEGQYLLMTFWMVNSHFFTRRIVGKAMHKIQSKQASVTATSSVN